MSGSSKPKFFDVVLSVLASAFGVQSHQNYQRDFTNGSLLPYIIVAVVLFVAFIVGLFFLVAFVTSR